jgi:type II secretory pathway pseudopilin PulG
MIEIAISLAVIGFALVAVIGILPLAINVQKENRQETIINQDANFLIDALRHGGNGLTNTVQGYAGGGLDDLTNYVPVITNYWTQYNGTNNPNPNPNIEWYTYSNSWQGSTFGLNSGYAILGLLGTPKYIFGGAGSFRSNHIVAFMRALSGAAIEKYPQTNSDIRADSFGYRLIAEVLPYRSYDDDFNPNNLVSRNMVTNLHDLKLTFRWPLLPKGAAGSGRQVFRVTTGGTYIPTVYNGQLLYFLQPQTYAQITNSVP